MGGHSMGGGGGFSFDLSVIDAADLRSRLFEAIDSIEGLSDLLSGGIIEYKEQFNGDLGSTLQGAPNNSLTIYFDGIEATTFPSLFIYKFGLCIKSDLPSLVYAAVLSGTPTNSGADGLRLLFTSIHPRFRPMALPSMRRLSIPMGQTSSFDYWEIATSFRDMGSGS